MLLVASLRGSILGLLLFLVYVHDLPNASRLLDPIMFADDAKHFFIHKSIKHLFTVVNVELEEKRVCYASTTHKLTPT